MSCAAPEQADPSGSFSTATSTPTSVSTPDAGPTVIQGRVVDAGGPVASAFVRLLDDGGEFTAEVVSGAGGQFRFFAAPGEWTVRALAPGASGTATVTAGSGTATVDVSLTPA